MSNGERKQVTKETFQKQDHDGKLDLLRDMQEDQNHQIKLVWETVQSMCNQCSTRAVACEQRFEKRGRRKWDNAFAIIGGFGGGLAFWATLFAMNVPIGGG